MVKILAKRTVKLTKKRLEILTVELTIKLILEPIVERSLTVARREQGTLERIIGKKMGAYSRANCKAY